MFDSKIFHCLEICQCNLYKRIYQNLYPVIIKDWKSHRKVSQLVKDVEKRNTVSLNYSSVNIVQLDFQDLCRLYRTNLTSVVLFRVCAGYLISFTPPQNHEAAPDAPNYSCSCLLWCMLGSSVVQYHSVENI